MRILVNNYICHCWHCTHCQWTSSAEVFMVSTVIGT